MNVLMFHGIPEKEKFLKSYQIRSLIFKISNFILKIVLQYRVVNLRLGKLGRAVTAQSFRWTRPGRAGQSGPKIYNPASEDYYNS